MQKGLDNQGPLGSESLAQAKLKGHWSGKYMNSRGREVFGFFVQSTGYPWVLVAEVETDEVFADLYRLLVILGGGLGASLVILLLLLVKFARGTSQPLRELAGYVEKLSLGEFNIEIPDSDRRDEIGNLTGALQRHVFSLQLVAKKLRDAKALKTKIMKTKAMKKAS